MPSGASGAAESLLTASQNGRCHFAIRTGSLLFWVIVRPKFLHFLSVSSTRPRLFVVLATVVALAIGGTLAGYAALTTSYRLTLDGETREVSSTGDTVAEVLAAEGVEITEHDLVAPELDEPIDEGSRIVVRFGRPVELTVDGETTTHWVTSTDVASALGELGTPYGRAELSTTRSAAIGRDGLALEVVTPKNLVLRLAGAKPVTRTVTALTVQEALAELGVEVGKIDRTKPGLGTTLDDGDRIVFTDFRIAKRQVKAEPVPFETVEEPDDSMYEGMSVTEREGETGTRNVTYKVVFKNGKLLRKTVLDQKVLTEPVSALVRVGTASVSSFGGSGVWDRLAECESGGNWAANTGNGYYGGLQFSLSTWRAYGGTGLPSQHSRETQIAIATKLRDASGGYGAWPHCSAVLGLPR
jgi:uncharacterized protein YabE (DUF348 family)